MMSVILIKSQLQLTPVRRKLGYNNLFEVKFNESYCFVQEINLIQLYTTHVKVFFI